jgi:hypothetical protein
MFHFVCYVCYSVCYRIGTTMNHIADNAGRKWNIKHITKDLMNTVYAECTDCIQRNNQGLKVIAILNWSSY